MIFKTDLLNRAQQAGDETVDLGLRAYLISVFNYMAAGLAVSGVAASLMGNYLLSLPLEQAVAFVTSPLFYVVVFSPFPILIIMIFKRKSLSYSSLQTLYWLFVLLEGVSLSTIFLIYQLGSIVSIFFIAATIFAVMSTYGYTTKRSLMGAGNFLFMGLLGLILASIVNMFLRSSLLEFGVSVFGVLLFIALTAYDTQRIKLSYLQDQTLPGLEQEHVKKTALFGAVLIYLDFLNLFLFLLRLFGKRR